MALLCTAVAVFALLALRDAAIDQEKKQLLVQATIMARQIRQGRLPPSLLESSHGEALQVLDSGGRVVVSTLGFSTPEAMISNLRPEVHGAFADAQRLVRAVPGAYVPPRRTSILAEPSCSSTGRPLASYHGSPILIGKQPADSRSKVTVRDG